MHKYMFQTDSHSIICCKKSHLTVISVGFAGSTLLLILCLRPWRTRKTVTRIWRKCQ